MKCLYRANFECRLPKRYDDSNMTCQLCLMGQHTDMLGLVYNAIMEKRMDNMEREATEHLASRYEEMAKKYPKQSEEAIE